VPGGRITVSAGFYYLLAVNVLELTLEHLHIEFDKLHSRRKKIMPRYNASVCDNIATLKPGNIFLSMMQQRQSKKVDVETTNDDFIFGHDDDEK
jgi:hypothetical protein